MAIIKTIVCVGIKHFIIINIIYYLSLCETSLGTHPSFDDCLASEANSQCFGA